MTRASGLEWKQAKTIPDDKVLAASCSAQRPKTIQSMQREADNRTLVQHLPELTIEFIIELTIEITIESTSNEQRSKRNQRHWELNRIG